MSTAATARSDRDPSRRSLAGNSARVGIWTLASRISGFARAAVIAAVLGPTFLGNTFLAVNMLPNLVYEFLTGSLLVTLLVPTLVQSIDAAGTERAAEVARGFLGTVGTGVAIVTVLAMAAAPLVVRVLTIGAPAEVEASQRASGTVLLLWVMPQVLLYALAGTGAAAMNATGRFALAAAAPIVENIGVIATMAVVGIRFGIAPEATDDTALLVTLGLGSTLAVAAHALVQWVGAHRAGITLYPTAGWRRREVREVLRRLVPSLGYAALNVARTFALLVTANRIRGGVVAFQLALNFYYLPVAVGARPVAVALLPVLSRLHARGRTRAFDREMVRGIGLALFLTVPAAALYVGLSEPLARAAGFGAMSDGTHLVALALAALAVGVIGEAIFVVATHASYARNDARSPLVAMVVRTLLTLAGIGLAASSTGDAVMVTLGLALTVGNVAGAIVLGRAVRADAPRSRRVTWIPSLNRAVIASAAMVTAALVVMAVLPFGADARWLPLAVAGAVAAITYLGAHLALGSPELRSLRAPTIEEELVP